MSNKIHALRLPKLHKRGAEFTYLLTMPPAFVDGFFAGAELHSQLRAPDARTLLDTLTVEWHDPATTRHLFVKKEDTKSWPLGPLLLDVWFVFPGGAMQPTRTFEIEVIQGMTYAPY